MANFIELVNKNGKKLFVNIDTVLYLGTLPSGETFLNFNDESHYIEVEETPQQIIAKMKELQEENKCHL